MIQMLKSAFAAEIRKMEVDCLNEFTAIRMEEGGYLEEHFTKMDWYYNRMVEIMDDRFYENLPMNILLGSRPPSYKGAIKAILRELEFSSYREVKDQLGDLEVDPLGGELIDEIMDE
jgi:hypothetical protein